MPYNAQAARQKAADHAGNFMFNREKQIDYLAGLMDRPPLLVSPYDAELFGHWWFEGPMWLEYLFRKIACDQKTIKTITAREYLEKYPRNQVLSPSMSSWGYNGYSEVWLNSSNQWIYRHLNQASARMVSAAEDNPNAHGLKKRALNQMARELLLAQSSDWAFIMKTGTHTQYAEKRTKEHLERFTRLWEGVQNNLIDTGYLDGIESLDNLFPDIDYQVYSSKAN
jgi:1,4-alpha-glucan branching enzyme